MKEVFRPPRVLLSADLDFQPLAHSAQALLLRAVVTHLRGSIVVSISACHAEDPGSIPGRGGMWHCPRVGWPSCRQLAQALFA